MNVDFEEMLQGKPARLALRASVEFLALWVQDQPIMASRQYSDEYLRYVQTHSGKPANITTKGEGDFWWGETADVERMRRLSSKTEFLKWWQARWPLEARACSSWNEVEAAIGEGQWLIKKSDGMSGRGHLRVNRTELSALKSRLENDLGAGVVVEPLYERTRDLSALWLPEEKRFIYYRNLIDERFQWRGAILENDTHSSLLAGSGDWEKHLLQLQQDVAEQGYGGPFSVDAFFYKKDGREIFHPGSEMNPRKTMGWVTRQLWQKRKSPVATLALVPFVLKGQSWQQATQLTDALLLSPESCPFVWYWIEAESLAELEEKRARFLRAIPGAPVRGKA